MQDVKLEVTRTQLLATSPKFYLLMDLPHEVLEDEGAAKWDGPKSTLRVTLPLKGREDLS